MFLFNQKEQTCVQIPLNVKGTLFISPIPFGPYDPGNALLKIYKQNSIRPIRFPITDDAIPELSAFSKEVDRITGYLRAGADMAVDCNSGIRRTGVMACYIVRDILKLDTDSAIAHVKQHKKTNMTNEQTRWVAQFEPQLERLAVFPNSHS